MPRSLSRLRRCGIGGALALIFACLGAGPAVADTPSTASCTAPTLSQPFLSVGDSNWYTLTAGQSVDNFDGSGWTLSGGASIKSSTLGDGNTGSVLDLPSGAKAVSPVMCVDNGYQTMRTMVRDLVGSEGVFFYVSYYVNGSWTNPKNTGQVHGNQTNWTLSNPTNVQPSNTTGWQLVRFTFVPGGTRSDFQIYNFWVDPRMCH